MTIEEQKKADTAKAEAEAKAKADKEKADAESAEGKTEDDDEADGIDKNNPDYEAELERERKAREDAEKALADKRYKESEKKRKAKEAEEDLDEEEDDEDKPLTKRELREILAGERSVIKKETQAGRIAEIAKSISESESEAKLIIEVHKNRQWPDSISLEQQMEEAHAIANRKKLVSKNSELARALKARETASKDFTGTQRDGMEGSAPKMSAVDSAAYTRAGFSFNAQKKLWQKKLPNGKILNKDPKSKRTFVS